MVYLRRAGSFINPWMDGTMNAAIKVLIFLILLPIAIYLLLPLVVGVGLFVDAALQPQLWPQVQYEHVDCVRDHQGHCLDGRP